MAFLFQFSLLFIFNLSHEFRITLYIKNIDHIWVPTTMMLNIPFQRYGIPLHLVKPYFVAFGIILKFSLLGLCYFLLRLILDSLL